MNKFATALKNPQNQKPVAQSPKSSRSNIDKRPCRVEKKHVGGYYDPEVSKQLRLIAVDEDSSVQALLAEAIDMLFQSRQKPTITQK